jgi:peptidoglycan/LPS O-acetylase OafA/YrhL
MAEALAGIFRPLRVESEEFLHLDVLRIVASLSIVAHHFRAGVTDFGESFFSKLFGLSPMVDLFFIISGVIITHVYGGRVNNVQGTVGFFRARAARLIPLQCR